MNSVIKDVIEDLENNKSVLFSGTACQVAAINSMVNEKNKNNLYTCDLICHGVPSERVFKDYLKYLEEKYNKKIKEFVFRNKKFGWHSHIETIIFEDDTSVSLEFFKRLFYRHNILRPACYKCNYANKHRPADITIADFWGIDEVCPEFDDDKGVSLVIVNSEKGKEIFNKIKDDLIVINVSIDDCIKHTYTLNRPTPISDSREEFWKDYENNSFDFLLKKYASE